MSSIDPSLISDPKEHRWVVEIDEIINHQLDVDSETIPLSLFQVPETITSKKPEAYEPQQIGLGPIHHFRPSPYKKMEQKKVDVMRKVLKDYHVKDYKLHVLDKVGKFVPTVRSCYDMFLQDDDESLARIFGIDGLFLLNLFHTYNARMDEYLFYLKTSADEKKYSNDEYIRQLREFDEYKGELEWVLKETDPLLLQKEIVVTVENQDQWEKILDVTPHQPKLPEVGLKKRLVAQDVLMVENQIPFMVLREINDSLKAASSSGNSWHSIWNLSPLVFRVFCEIHSPLKLCSKSHASSSVDHLLHYMYYSIVNNVPEEKAAVVVSDEKKKPDADKKDDQRHEYPEDREGDFEPLISKFISKLPQEEVVQLYEQTISMLEAFAHISKTLVPSATILHDEAGFQFRSLEENKGIQNIQLAGEDICLPIITLNNDSEVILRNLVAYETLTASSDSSSFPLNEYMGLMCGLIANEDDVNYLKTRNVITGDMPADEVVKLFAGISSAISTVETKEKSKLRGVIEEINKVYESGVKMKTYLLLQKLARWLLVVLKAIGTSVESSWKIVAFMVSVVTVFLLTYQAYCDSFGCHKIKTVTLLPYASS